ncbi:hypothetical protein CDL36_28575 [Escherichia coli]|nr:hypothetical protein CDL36_28575 [Escherichia coli]
MVQKFYVAKSEKVVHLVRAVIGIEGEIQLKGSVCGTYHPVIGEVEFYEGHEQVTCVSCRKIAYPSHMRYKNLINRPDYQS